MTDEQLRQAVSKGFANPKHLDELLTKVLTPDRQQDVRTNLAQAITSGQISNEELQRFISQLKSAAHLDEFDQILAELRHANRLIQSGVVVKDSPLITSAKLGREYNLGPTFTQIDPVPEADALYLGTDGLLHLHEVKNTAKALRDKLNRHPEQLQRMQKWRAKAPEQREIRIVIGTEAGWTQIFAVRPGEEEAALQVLIAQGIPLTIGEYNLSVAKMDELWQATARKINELKKQKNWSGWKRFYNQMSTLRDTEIFLGVTLQ